MGTAGFDRDEDHWPRQWAQAYVDFASGEKRAWLHEQGMRWFPIVGWAERGGYGAIGHGNSVPRFHITWGTGPGVVEPFERRVRAAADAGPGALPLPPPRRRTDRRGRRGAGRPRPMCSSRRRRARPQELARRGRRVRTARPGRDRHLGRHRRQPRARAPQLAANGSGRPPKKLLTGVPDHVDGRMLEISQDAGANIINPDRMWHYTEGIANYDPIWSDHGIRILPGPSSLWLDATGKRLPGAAVPWVRHARHARAHRPQRPRAHLVRAHDQDRRRRSSRCRAPSRTRT